MEFALVARTPVELQAAHTEMVAWCEQKTAEVEGEVRALGASINAAIDANLVVNALDRQLKIAEKRLVFYGKVKEALRAGYFIVPNFPMDVFAIRTKAKGPRSDIEKSHWARFLQPAQLLPEGEGRYVSASPTVQRWTEPEKRKDGSQYDQAYSRPVGFKDVEFPVALAKPEVLTATGLALERKLFDELGIAQDRTMYGDPMILGRVRNPRPHRPSVTFFVAWWFDPARL